MSYYDQIEMGIAHAIENRQPCPICGARIYVAGGTEDSDIYAHECECSLELDLVKHASAGDHSGYDDIDEVSNKYAEGAGSSFGKLLTNFYFPNLLRVYKSHCHYCRRYDGVDNRLQECTPDPPYGYRCKHCGHSLRTHYLLGEGKLRDKARWSR